MIAIWTQGVAVLGLPTWWALRFADVSLTPDLNGLPGGAELQSLTNGLGGWALVLALVGLLIGAVAFGLVTAVPPDGVTTMLIGTLLPVGALSGIWTSTSYTPIRPGATWAITLFTCTPDPEKANDTEAFTSDCTL